MHTAFNVLSIQIQSFLSIQLAHTCYITLQHQYFFLSSYITRTQYMNEHDSNNPSTGSEKNL